MCGIRTADHVLIDLEPLTITIDVSKVFDFFDTFFMIVRRNFRQISFLHVYHHTTIFVIYWLNIRANYDGDIYLTIVLNSFIHLVMYSYYFLTTFNVTVPKPIKALITNMQMIQFITMNAQVHLLLTIWIMDVYIFNRHRISNYIDTHF